MKISCFSSLKLHHKFIHKNPTLSVSIKCFYSQTAVFLRNTLFSIQIKTHIIHIKIYRLTIYFHFILLKCGTELHSNECFRFFLDFLLYFWTWSINFAVVIRLLENLSANVSRIREWLCQRSIYEWTPELLLHLPILLT